MKNILKEKIKQAEMTLSGLKEYLIYKNEVEKNAHPMYSKKEVIRMINCWEGYINGLNEILGQIKSIQITDSD